VAALRHHSAASICAYELNDMDECEPARTFSELIRGDSCCW